MYSIIAKFFEDYIRRDWRGFLVGTIGIGIVLGINYYIFLYPKLEEFHNYGQKAGVYNIGIGKIKSVATNELKIEFTSLLYNVRKKDSLLVYPYVSIKYKNNDCRNFRLCNEDFRNMPIDELFYFDATHYYYMVRMVDLEESGDTVATFEVYKKEYPELNRVNGQ